MADWKNLSRDYALPFAAWELRLYLNSHPHDRCALKLYYQLLSKSRCATYAHTDMDCSPCYDQDNGTALNHMDDAACPGCGNLSDLMDDCNNCGCDNGDSCPIRWCWTDDPWPWDGCCPNCAD